VRAAPLTFAFLAVNVVVFIVAEIHGRTTENGILLRFGAVQRYHVWIGEYWRLVTPMFLHIGVVHLLWNAYAGVGWCTTVERVLGTRRFGALYLLSGIGGAAASVLGHKVVSAGASGAMFGVVGATLILRQRVVGSWAAFRNDPQTRTTLMGVAMWIALGVFLGFDNYGHGGGFVVGAAITWALTSRTGQRAAYGVFAAAFAALVVAAVHPGWHPSADDAELLFDYGARYESGEDSFPRDPVRAARFFALACEAGERSACDAIDGSHLPASKM
jgi:rhomboid protease GluP